MSRCFIIAEIGQAHDGSLGFLHSYIEALASTGIDAIKFQIHIAEAESSIHEPFRINFSYEDKSRFDYWKRMGFTPQQWKEIKKHCDEVGIEFLASPFSMAAVDLLEKLNVKRYKIGSGEVNNFLMLEKIAKTGKPIIISSGMSTYQELDTTVSFINDLGNELTILQCTTSYPTPAEKLGLNVLQELKNRYPESKVGLSEHTGKIYAGIAAAAIGIDVLEIHAVFDRRMFGPDAQSSLTIDEIALLVKSVRATEMSLANPVEKNTNEEYRSLKSIFEKSLAINKDLPKGHQILFEDLESKKPAKRGIPAANFKEGLGKRLTRNMFQWDFLNKEDLHEA